MRRFAPALACSLLLAPPALAGGLHVWVDEDGHTHVTDDAASIPEPERARDGRDDGLDELWSEGWAGPGPERPTHTSSAQDDRVRRLLAGALDDLRRGESARARATLDGVLRLEPGLPEAHWYLALLDQQRGRLDSAERHLSAFLAHAGDDLAGWRASAARRLQTLRDERTLADEEVAPGRLELVSVDSPHFRIRYDRQLELASPDYEHTAVRYLEEAFEHVSERLGSAPRRPTRVVLYGKAAYLAAHQHRFSFPTVGFFDGRMHVASAAHPAGELRALLFHEYTHAVFHERTGGHRPFWLNEGWAELAERAARHQHMLTGSEMARLRRQIASGAWIPLHELEAGFGGLDESAARLAYLEATAAAAWLEERSDPIARAELLDLLRDGAGIDAALVEIVGLDTDGVDRAVRHWIAAHFPVEARAN